MEPTITVETIGVPWADYNSKLLALYAAGDPPEFSANYAASFPTFSANDAIVALDKWVSESDVGPSVIEQAALDAVTRQGQLWVLALAHLCALQPEFAGENGGKSATDRLGRY